MGGESEPPGRPRRSAMPPLNGVLETALYVQDLPRSVRFYRTLLEAEPLVADERMAGFPIDGRQVLLLFKQGSSVKPIPTSGGIIPPHDGTGQAHLAFAVAAADLERWRGWLREKGVS